MYSNDCTSYSQQSLFIKISKTSIRLHDSIQFHVFFRHQVHVHVALVSMTENERASKWLSSLLEIQLVPISQKDQQFDGWCNLHSENKKNILLSYWNRIALNRHAGQTNIIYFTYWCIRWMEAEDHLSLRLIFQLEGNNLKITRNNFCCVYM